MDPSVIYNCFEIVLWSAIGVALVIRGWNANPAMKRLALLTAAAFLVFAVTDLIELRTGAWWDPWWLLALNAMCLGAFCYAFFRYRSMRQIGRR